MSNFKTFVWVVLCSFSSLCAQGLEHIRRNGIRAYMIDYNSQKVLFSHNAQTLMFPSSMQKCLLAALTFDYIGDKDPTKIFFRTSEKAAKQGGTSMFLEPGSRVSIDDLVDGLLVVSGNDAAVALAEGMFGSETAGAEAMNNLAQRWGCSNTTVRNATGFTNEQQQTTAYDLVLIGQTLFEKYLQQWYRFSKKTFTHNKITQRNKNVAIGVAGFNVDGVKSGFTGAAGYGLLFTAWKGDRRIFGIVNGCKSKAELKKFVIQMLAFGFES